MKFSKFCAMFAVAAAATGVFADAANVLVSFSTTADKYADGTAVKDGEWYALCWSADDAFDGLQLDCTPVNSNEKVLILAPLAKGGRCPSVIFQIDSTKAPSGGNYFVYLLDTRDANGDVSAVATTEGRRVPANVVNGSAVAKSYTASSSEGFNVASSSSSSETAVESAGWAAVQPKITGFALVGDATVKITVAGMMSGLTYKVSLGAAVDKMTTTNVTPTTEDGEVSFYVTDKDARFFKVVAE